jgi:hypothetical protein
MKYIFTALLFTAVIFFSLRSNQTNRSVDSLENLKTEQFTVNTDRDTVFANSQRCNT